MNHFIALMFVVAGTVFISRGWGNSDYLFVIGVCLASVGLAAFAQED